MKPVWDWFIELSRTRAIGMAANPISFLEIEAYCRLTHVRMSAWQVRLIRRLDDAVLATVAANAPKTRPSNEPINSEIPVSRVGAIRDLFRGLAARKAKQLET